MSSHVTIPIARPTSVGTRATDTSFTDLAPEIQKDMYRRLGWISLVYAGTWFVLYLHHRFVLKHEFEPIWTLFTVMGIVIGVAGYVVCRRRWIPPGMFSNFASAFEVAGAIGIMVGSLGWEHRGDEILRRIGEAVGIGPDAILDQLVLPLEERNLRVLYHEGVTWVGIWLLAYPFVVPSSAIRSTITTLLTAATVPAILGVSLLINGIPDSTRLWVTPYFTEMTIPTFIAAGIAIACSRVVFKLTRDLSQARQMGSYQLVEKIGEGGMGEVWEARHRMLVRPAAIKLIRGGTAGNGEGPSEMTLRRFQREAQATAELSSPHTIELYDFGVTDDGTFFYVMELLRGIDLRTLVEQFGPVPAERAIHILREACHSLSDAHLAGMVHRDVKPGNLFVCRSGSDHDFVKVLDFGLVKQIEQIDRAASQLTMEGIAGGTPAFMAPEMAYHDRPVDGRADLYALGCVGYWLLTGTLVFEGDSPVAVLVQHVKEEPAPPSTRTELPIPADLERIIMACLNKSPEDRPSTARELAERLGECARSLKPWSEERASQWWQTNLPQHCRATPDAEVAAVPTMPSR